MSTFGKIGATPLVKHWSAADYVRSGLIALWDGIENAGIGTHNSSATTWKNLVNANYDLSGVEASKWDSESLLFSGNSLASSSSVFDSKTIEAVVCCTAQSGINHIFLSKAASKNRLWLDSGLVGMGYYYYEPCGNIDFQNKKINVVGVTGTAYYSNGAPLTTMSSKNMTYVINKVQIGPFTGRIYCVRVYSRALSAAEIAHNYQIDKLRFNLV